MAKLSDELKKKYCLLPSKNGEIIFDDIENNRLEIISDFVYKLYKKGYKENDIFLALELLKKAHSNANQSIEEYVSNKDVISKKENSLQNEIDNLENIYKNLRIELRNKIKKFSKK